MVSTPNPYDQKTEKFYNENKINELREIVDELE